MKVHIQEPEIKLYSDVITEIRTRFYITGLDIFCKKTHKVIQSTLRKIQQSQSLPIYSSEISLYAEGTTILGYVLHRESL